MPPPYWGPQGSTAGYAYLSTLCCLTIMKHMFQTPPLVICKRETLSDGWRKRERPSFGDSAPLLWIREESSWTHNQRSKDCEWAQSFPLLSCETVCYCGLLLIGVEVCVWYLRHTAAVFNVHTFSNQNYISTLCK